MGGMLVVNSPGITYLRVGSTIKHAAKVGVVYSVSLGRWVRCTDVVCYVKMLCYSCDDVVVWMLWCGVVLTFHFILSRVKLFLKKSYCLQITTKYIFKGRIKATFITARDIQL